MGKEEQYFNPKGLDLEMLKEADGKVTLGFKIEPELKLQLAQMAQEKGLTLSSYVNMLVTEAQGICEEIRIKADEKLEKIKKRNSFLEAQLAFYKTDVSKQEFIETKSRNVELEKKISFYEDDDVLQLLYKKHVNQKVNYCLPSGVISSKQVVKVEDVFKILVNSYKYKK